MRHKFYYRSSLDAAAVPISNTLSTLSDWVDEYAAVPFTTSIDNQLNGNSPWSFSFWIKRVNSGATQRIVANYGYDPAPEYGLLLSIQSDNTFRMDFGNILNGGVSAIVITSSTEITTSWQHVAVTYDGSKTAAGLVARRNGDLMNRTILLDTWTVGVIPSRATGLVFGRLPVHNIQYLGANLDEIAFYTTKLTATQLSQLYNSGVPATPPSSGLESFWRMGDGDTFPTIVDTQGTNDMTMFNMEAGDFVSDVP
jgi:hypothetical protein